MKIMLKKNNSFGRVLWIGGEMMLITESNFLSGNSFSHLLPVNRNGRKITKILRIATNIQAQKRGLDEDSRVNQKTHFSFRFPYTILFTQSAIGVLGLGFIDAGYSGDWSRIGVITKEAEDLLKLAAFVVVPCCIYLIWSLSKKNEP